MSAPLPFSKRFVVENIVSKNMFNKNNIKQNWYLSYSDGKTLIWDSNMAYMIDFIEVEPNQQYTMSFLEEATIFNIYEYDENKNFIQHQQQNNDKTSFTITTSTTTKFVRLSCGKSRIEKMQFEQSSHATVYCKYFDFSREIKQVSDINISKSQSITDTDIIDAKEVVLFYTVKDDFYSSVTTRKNCGTWTLALGVDGEIGYFGVNFDNGSIFSSTRNKRQYKNHWL